jgi:hypothetical protein
VPVRRRPSETFGCGVVFRSACDAGLEGSGVRVRLTAGFGYANFTFLSFFGMGSRTRKGKQSMKVVTRRLSCASCLGLNSGFLVQVIFRPGGRDEMIKKSQAYYWRSVRCNKYLRHRQTPCSAQKLQEWHSTHYSESGRDRLSVLMEKVAYHLARM